jgi:hypothetical protein
MAFFLSLSEAGIIIFSFGQDDVMSLSPSQFHDETKRIPSRPVLARAGPDIDPVLVKMDINLMDVFSPFLRWLLFHIVAGRVYPRVTTSTEFSRIVL